MRLRAYLDVHQEMPLDFATRAKITKNTIYRALEGRWLSMRSAARIVRATRGEVTYEDLEGRGRPERGLSEWIAA